MTEEDKQIIDRAVKENWRTGDRTRLKRLLEKNLKLYRENEELKLELTVEKDLLQEETNLHLHAEEYIKSLEKENQELKEQYAKECEDVCYVVTNYNKQLTKATEIIKELLNSYKYVIRFREYANKKPIADAEQFLKETEK